MSEANVKTTVLTPKSDREGVLFRVCDPGWFDKSSVFRIQNAPSRTAGLEFTGSDLNFVSRVLYAESSGSAQISDKDARAKEKQAILNVKHFRLNRRGYPNAVKAMTFTEVCKAPNQFESVYAASRKFSGSGLDSFESLNGLECKDLAEAIDAVRYFFAHGPDKELVFDNFRGGKVGKGKNIGLSRFWLSSEGARLHEKNE